MLVAALLLLVGGVVILPRNPIVGSSNILFFGFIGAFALLNLHSGRSYLLLTRHGFKYSSPFQEKFVAWDDVQSFATVTVALQSTVGWSYKRKPQARPKAFLLVAPLVGADDVLPDTYGMLAGELMALMDGARVAQDASRRRRLHVLWQAP